MRSFTELDVWRRARELSTTVYQLSRAFPKEEIFGLALQIRKAAVSVPSNIAEGVGRQTTKDAIGFFYIPRGSLFEIETQLYIAFDEKYITEQQLSDALEEILHCKKLLHGFINYYKGLPTRIANRE